MMDDQIKISLINVNGIRDYVTNTKLKHLCHKALQHDITFITESHLSLNLEHRVKSLWDGPIFFNHNTNANTNGLIALCKPTFNLKNAYNDPEGRCSIFHYDNAHSHLCFCLIYAPSSTEVALSLIHI